MDWVMVVLVFGPATAILALWGYIVFIRPWRKNDRKSDE